MGDFIVVLLIGVLVGTGELIARYRDAPFRALWTWYAGVYVGFNAVASVAALALIHVYGWTFGAAEGSDQVRWTQVLVAGFGAMALFRSSLFIVRAGDQDIGIGPVSFLQVILAASDRGVDRKRAEERAPIVTKVMQGLSFEDVHQSLPAFSGALMQNLSQDDQVAIGDQVTKLVGANMPDQAKVLNLGLLLMNFVGEDVLRAAVTSLKESLRTPPPAPAGDGSTE